MIKMQYDGCTDESLRPNNNCPDATVILEARMGREYINSYKAVQFIMNTDGDQVLNS